MCLCVDTIVKLALLHGPKSLWETFSADCNLFQEHQPSVTVSLMGEQCKRSHKHTVEQISQEITCCTEEMLGNASHTALCAHQVYKLAHNGGLHLQVTFFTFLYV